MCMVGVGVGVGVGVFADRSRQNISSYLSFSPHLISSIFFVLPLSLSPFGVLALIAITITSYVHTSVRYHTIYHGLLHHLVYIFI